jgi:DNA-binding MarR family transcriptional regulator
LTRTRRESLGFLVADLSRLMRRAFAQRIRGSSLTLAQARALVYLSRNEGMRQVDLAAVLEVQPITLARLVDQLHAGGLVERRTDPADGRAYRLYLRPGAKAPLEEIARVGATVRAQALKGLSEREANAMLDGLRRMRENLS